MRRIKISAVRPALLFVLALITVGCSKPSYQVGEVDGALTIHGQPGTNVHIEFVPDAGVEGPRSAADTDGAGHFTLHVMEKDGSSPAGAVVGQHKVTLTDRALAASATGRGVPIRFGPEYTLTSSTPLAKEVVAGKQTITLALP